ERRPRRRAEGRGHPRRVGNAGRAGDRDQRRHGAVARRGLRRARPARVADGRARAARAGLRRLGDGYPLTVELTLPAKSCACAVKLVTGTPTGIVNVPAASPVTIVVCPLTTTVTVAGSSSENTSACGSTTVSVGGVSPTVTGSDCVTGPSPSSTVNASWYDPSGTRAPAAVPSHVTVCGPGPSVPWNNVARTTPSCSTCTASGTGCARTNVAVSVSDTPSPLGEISSVDGWSEVSVRSTTTGTVLRTDFPAAVAVTASR